MSNLRLFPRLLPFDGNGCDERERGWKNVFSGLRFFSNSIFMIITTFISLFFVRYKFFREIYLYILWEIEKFFNSLLQIFQSFIDFMNLRRFDVVKNGLNLKFYYPIFFFLAFVNQLTHLGRIPLKF